jgi:hypothetical protein
MGLGDWIMASADVKEANERTGKLVKLGNGTTMYLDKNIFSNNPRMAKAEDTDVVWVANYPGKRPYLAGNDGKHLIFDKTFKATAGELYLTSAERGWARKRIKGDYIVVEPNVKKTYIHTVNKSWPYFDELLKTDLPWVQLGDVNVKTKTRKVDTASFREALSVLSGAKLFVGTDGALHHAAAALGIPAVVIWTGFTSPRHLGYDSHINIHDGGEPCGTYYKVCEHCKKIARTIPVEQVREAVIREFESSRLARELQTP